MRIEIIMTTFNNLELTKKTIASIEKYTNDYHLTIIDNNSNDKMKLWLKDQKAEVYYMDSNFGVAEARNIGIRHLSADCEYVLFVDNDIEVTQEDWLPRLLAGFISKEIGAVGPCSDFISGLQTINFKSSKQYLYVPFLITFCMLVRREVVDLIGDFDGFGANWGNTDIDYSIRMRQAGYKLINARDVFVRHKGYETKQRQNELVALKEKFIEKWGLEKFNDLYNFDKWLNMPENQGKKKISIIGVDNVDKKIHIEEKLSRIGLDTQVASFQNQIPSLDNLLITLSEEDQKIYKSKLDKNKKLALFELPASCNLSCKYCYVNNRQTKNQNYSPEYFSDWLYKVDPHVQWIIWLCSEGEPAFYPKYDEIIDRLIRREGYIVATTTNLTQDTLLNLALRTYDSLGILWSVHYAELERKGLLDRTFERARILADKGASIAPLVIATKYNLKRIEEINSRFEKIGLKPILRHERVFPQNKQWYHRELTELWELQAIQKARQWGWSFLNYDYEHLRFHVKGGSCSAGINFLAILADWSIASCCGCGQKLGIFPELPKEYKQGLCIADCCPCPFPHELGMNSKILTFTMAQSYFFNNPKSLLYKSLDIYLSNSFETEVSLEDKSVEISLNNMKVKFIRKGSLASRLHKGEKFEQFGLDFLLKYLKDNSVFIDVGVGIGYYSIISKLLKPGASVYGFEPCSATYKNCLENLKLNNLSENIVINNLALLDYKGKGILKLHEQDGLNTLGKPFVESKSLGQEEVKITTLDLFLQENNIKKVDIIKADIEGGELQLFRGAVKLLSRRDAPTILFENVSYRTSAFGHMPQHVESFLQKLGYQIRQISTEMFIAQKE